MLRLRLQQGTEQLEGAKERPEKLLSEPRQGMGKDGSAVGIRSLRNWV